MLTLDQLNAASAAEFTALLDGTYEHSPWVAEGAVPVATAGTAFLENSSVSNGR